MITEFKRLQKLAGIKEEDNFLQDENPLDDIPGISIHIDDDNNMTVQMTALYHDSTNGKIALLKDNPVLQNLVMKAIQAETQNAFRKAVHGVLGLPFGLDESKK